MSAIRAALYSIPNGFAGILDISGRSRPALFWPYLLICLSILIVLEMWLFAALPFAVAPEAASMARSMATQMQEQAIVGLIANTVFLALSTAVIVRRLHDSGRSGLWLLAAVIPAFLGHATIGSSLLAKSAIVEYGHLMLSVSLGFEALFWIAAVVLFAFLCLPSEARDNRYGVYDPVDLVDRLWLTRQEVNERLENQERFKASEWTP
jgi:uncharacterized membrane protein YhaH (DUF805 family)